MSEHIKQTIAEFEQDLAAKLAEVKQLREMINLLSQRAGLPVPYPEVDEPKQVGGTIRGDTFYGQTLHIAMRRFLDMRGKTIGPASVNQIYDAMKTGGYQFDTKSDDNAKRVIRITLAKNSTVFHKLPNGEYGLLEWYPNAKPAKAGTTTKKDGTVESEEDAAAAEEEIEEGAASS